MIHLKVKYNLINMKYTLTINELYTNRFNLDQLKITSEWSQNLDMKFSRCLNLLIYNLLEMIHVFDTSFFKNEE